MSVSRWENIALIIIVNHVIYFSGLCVCPNRSARPARVSPAIVNKLSSARAATSVPHNVKSIIDEQTSITIPVENLCYQKAMSVIVANFWSNSCVHGLAISITHHGSGNMWAMATLVSKGISFKSEIPTTCPNMMWKIMMVRLQSRIYHSHNPICSRVTISYIICPYHGSTLIVE